MWSHLFDEKDKDRCDEWYKYQVFDDNLIWIIMNIELFILKICLTCLDLGASKSADPGGATAAEPGGKCGMRLSLL